MSKVNKEYVESLEKQLIKQEETVSAIKIENEKIVSQMELLSQLFIKVIKGKKVNYSNGYYKLTLNDDPNADYDERFLEINDELVDTMKKVTKEDILKDFKI